MTKVERQYLLDITDDLSGTIKSLNHFVGNVDSIHDISIGHTMEQFYSQYKKLLFVIDALKEGEK